MVPDSLEVIRKQKGIHDLDDTPIFLLKYDGKYLAIWSFEDFVAGSLQPQQKHRAKT